MWNWFKRKNAKPIEDKEKGTSRFNASDVSVEVDGKKVTVAELEEAIVAKEAEDAEEQRKRELQMANDHEPISMDESVTLANGKEYKVGDLVANWKARAGKKNAADEAAAKEKAEKEAAEKAELDKKNALVERAKAVGLKENATEEEVTAKEKEAADNKAAEEALKKENAKKGLASFKEIKNAPKSFAPEGSRAPVGVKTREERAKDWAKRNARKA